MMAVDPVTAGIGLVDTFINKFVKDKDLAEKLRAEANSEEFQGEISLALGQIAVNKIEAASRSLFVSGWRPFIGWTCGIALFYNFILYQILKFAVVLFVNNPPVLPVLETGELMTVLLGMLGLGGMRTYEKFKQVSREQ